MGPQHGAGDSGGGLSVVVGRATASRRRPARRRGAIVTVATTALLMVGLASPRPWRATSTFVVAVIGLVACILVIEHVPVIHRADAGERLLRALVAGPFLAIVVLELAQREASLDVGFERSVALVALATGALVLAARRGWGLLGPTRVLVVGGGDAGRRFAARWAARGLDVRLLTSPLPPERAPGVGALVLGREIPPDTGRALAAATGASRTFVLDAARPEGVGIVGHPLLPVGRAFKRSLDIVVAAALLVLTAPVLVAIAAVVTLESPGGWLFSQERVGLGGRRFRLYKVRTMRRAADDAEHRRYVGALMRGDGNRQHGGLFKLTTDARITRAGALLRRLSLDELPQLWNVLRGDMSIVGPRPALPHEVAQYSPQVLERLRVKPGLTGLWQVSGRSRLTFEEMVELDVRYWQEWSPLRELQIIAATPRALLAQETA